MARLYVDENLGDLLAGLRAAGHDIVYAQESGPGRTDAWHFREALTSQRTILTLDRKDFQYMHRLWSSLVTLGVVRDHHSGILRLTDAPQTTHDDWLPPLHTRLAEPTTVRGRLLTWYPERGEWYEDKWKPED